jgi:hypothetical protein
MMDIVSDDSKQIQKIPKIPKTSISIPICTTLVVLGPYLWLIVRAIEGTPKLLFLAVVSPILAVWATLVWVWFFHCRKTDKLLKEELLQYYNTSDNEFGKDGEAKENGEA